MSSLPSSTRSVHRARCPANANDATHAANTNDAVQLARNASKKHTTRTIAAICANRWGSLAMARAMRACVALGWAVNSRCAPEDFDDIDPPSMSIASPDCERECEKALCERLRTIFPDGCMR